MALTLQEDRVNLLSRSFVTTDVRLGARLGRAPVTVSAGGGAAWHEGVDLPYFVFGADVTVLNRPDVRLGLQGEVQWLRVTGDRFRRTYLDSELGSEEFVERVHRWSHALLMGFHLDLPL